MGAVGGRVQHRVLKAARPNQERKAESLSQVSPRIKLSSSKAYENNRHQTTENPV